MTIDIGFLNRLKCLFGHDYWFDRAKDLQPNEANRVYADDRPNEPIDGCTIVDKCQRCGKEKDMKAPVSIAERRGLPLEWEDE